MNFDIILFFGLMIVVFFMSMWLVITETKRNQQISDRRAQARQIKEQKERSDMRAFSLCHIILINEHAIVFQLKECIQNNTPYIPIDMQIEDLNMFYFLWSNDICLMRQIREDIRRGAFYV